MRVAGYIRVSTEEQAREGYGLSAQRQAVESYCKAQGWELVEVYEDAGISGKSRKGREALQRLLEAAASRSFERVVFLRLDRLGRSLKDLLEICDQLEVAEVGVVSIQESIDTGTAAGRMVRSFLGAVAEFERDSIVSRIKAGLAEKARQGRLLGEVPPGYIRQDGEVLVDETVAPLIRSMFEHYALGDVSMRDISRWAADAGLLSKRGAPLDRTSAYKMLKNPAYAGMVTHKGKVVAARGKHEGIVDIGLFIKVQELMTSRRRTVPPKRPFGRDPYPLSGTARCSSCGEGMVGIGQTQYWKGASFYYLYYRCSTVHRRGKAACEQKAVQAHTIEDQVVDYVGGMRLSPDYLGEVVAELRRRRARPDRPDERQLLQKQHQRLKRLFVLGEIAEAEFVTEAAPIKVRLAEIEKPSDEVLDVEAAVNLLRNMGQLWKESPRDQQRAFVREVFERIVVGGKEIVSIMPRALYAPLFLLDRQERFGGDQGRLSRLAPGTGVAGALLLNVPALILPSPALLVPA